MTKEINYDGTITCAVSVSDLGKAMSWYQEVLGFKETFRIDDMGWAEVTTSTPGVTLGLSQVEKVETGGGATIVFGVTDVDATRAELVSKDVRFDGETQVIPEMVKLATFYDPDGNTFMLAQNLTT